MPAIPTSMPSRGAFIVFEGCDRVGKSTQIAKLMEALKQKGVDVVDMRFPDRMTPTGKMINDYLTKASELNDKAVHLLFAANRWEVCQKITELLRSNKTIVCDRYAASGAVFSAAKGLNLDWCCSADAGLPLPDLTVYLRTASPAQLLASRPGFGQERYETEAFQSQVAIQFDRLLELDKSAACQANLHPTWLSVDASLPLEKSHDIILNSAVDTINNVNPEIRTLWPHLSLSPKC